MASDRRRLLGNMASLFTLQGANYALPLVTLPYLVRVLGPEKFGIIAFAQAFIQYFVVATDYGFNLSATRDVAVYREDSQKLGEIIGAVMAIKIALATAGASLLALLILLVPTFRQHWPLYAVVYLTVVGATFFPGWLFQGLERMRDITRMNIAARLLTTAAIFILIHNPNDYIVAAAIQSIPALLAAIPAWIVLRNMRDDIWQRPSLKIIQRQIKGGWHLFLSSAAINIYTSSNTVVLGLLTNPIQVGYYSVANKIGGAILGLYQPINQTIYPHISQLSAVSREQAISFINNIYYKYVVSGAAITILVYFFSRQLVVIIAGMHYMDSIPILETFAFLPFILSFGHIYGGLTMLPLGMNRAFSRVVVTSMLIDLISIYPLVQIYNAEGAAMATILAEIVVSVLAFSYTRKYKVLSQGLV